jgi:hypothetical protein
MSREFVSTAVAKLEILFEHLIAENRNNFQKAREFKVTVQGISGHYFLDKLWGSYEASLPNLIHQLMWKENLYSKFLNSTEMKDAEMVIRSDPDAIYRPDTWSERDELVCDVLDEISFKVTNLVGENLSIFDFFDNIEFVRDGYLEGNED